MRSIPAVLLVLSLGCRMGPDAGTAVGNPGDGLTVRVAPDFGITASSAELLDARIVLAPCSGPNTVLADPVDLDLLEPRGLLLPAGSWCRIYVRSASTLMFRGTGPDGQDLDLELDIGVVSTGTGTPFVTDNGTGLAFLLGGTNWPGAQGLPATDLVVRPGDAEHDALVTEAAANAVTFEDPNGDGVRSQSERVVAAATPADFGLPEPPVDDDPEDDEEDDDSDDTDDEED